MKPEQAASMGGLVLAVGALVTLVLRHEAFGTGPVTIGAQVAAALLMLWARVTFGMRSFHAAASPTDGGLVTTGPYRFMRNPIYAAILLFLGAAIAAHPTAIAIAAGFVATVGTVIRIVAEERLLGRQFLEYDAYAARTKRIIPFVL